MLDQRCSYPLSAAVTNAGTMVALVVSGAAFSPPHIESLASAAQPLQQVREWESFDMYARTATAEPSQEPEAVLGEFASKIVEEIVYPAPEIDAFITEHFWELV